MDYPLFSDSGVPLPIKPEGIAFDMDGTLLDYDGHMSKSVAQAVRLLAKTGIKIFLVTGRLQSSTEGFWRELGLDTPVATCNGAHIGIPGRDPVLHLRLSERGRDAVRRLERDHGLYVNYYIDNHAYSLSGGPDRDWYSRQFVLVESLRDEADLMARHLPTKCLCITPENEHQRIWDLFAEALGDEANITESNERFVEILPPKADKGFALRALSEMCNIPMDRFVAVGDALNDLPMLQIAGFAIAFKSGNPILADHVDMMLPPLWEGGMDILARCILGMTDSGRFLTTRSGRFRQG